MYIMIVDDHAEVRASMSEFLGQLGHRVQEVASARDALVSIGTSRPDLVVTDLRMPDMDGLGLLEHCEALDDPPPIALMTAFGDSQTAVDAMRRGAIDYLRKPIDVRELHRLVERIERDDFTPSSVQLATTSGPDHSGLITCGATMQRVVTLADRLHRAGDVPCLIEGETGTGKELFARRIHHGPAVNDAPFVAINAAAVAPGLFEAELFGYVEGAFTGARAGGAPGKVELANKGTLFLDEIGDLPMEQQAKLLRLLEEKTYYPVGGAKELVFTGRIVCATNVRLLEKVHAGKFREDVYYRLKVGHLQLPALRDRDDTVVELARLLLAVRAKRRQRGDMRFGSAAERALAAHTWPGNVRELVHVIDQCLIFTDGAVIDVDHLGLVPTEKPTTRTRIKALASFALSPVPPADLIMPDAHFDLDQWHQSIIAAALAHNAYSPVKTAQYLGISRKVLYTLRKRYGLLDAEDAAEDASDH